MNLMYIRQSTFILLTFLFVPFTYASAAENTPQIHTQGSTAPKVTVIEYSDFECPFCQKNEEVMSKLYAQYKKDVQWQFRHFPLPFHTNAETYAVSTECVSNQGKDFFAYKSNLMTALRTGKTFTNQNRLVQIARKNKVNPREFIRCMRKFDTSTIKADITSGIALGVNGTPTTFVVTKKGTETISGAVPIEVYKTAIDKALQE